MAEECVLEKAGLGPLPICSRANDPVTRQFLKVTGAGSSKRADRGNTERELWLTRSKVLTKY
jgi:hypothetical protein